VAENGLSMTPPSLWTMRRKAEARQTMAEKTYSSAWSDTRGSVSMLHLILRPAFVLI